MENFVDYDNFQERIEKAKEAEEKRMKEARRVRNVAAMVDFATNLVSLVGYNKGSRYTIGTSLLGKQLPLYLQARQNFDKAMNDYKGVIAKNGLLKRLRENRDTTGMRPIGFIGNGTRKTQRPLSSGMFENALKEYKNSYNRKNYKL